MSGFKILLKEIHNCKACESYLPLGVRPVLQIHPDAKILIAGQAPGRRAHESGVPFSDPSGDRLRQWMGLTQEVFYEPKKIAIVPMGFCFPGTHKLADCAPRPECEPLWRTKVLEQLRNIQLTIVLGKYAQAYHFGKEKNSLTQRVSLWQEYWPEKILLPHPSPRNNLWLQRNPWFESEVIPALRQQVIKILYSEE